MRSGDAAPYRLRAKPVRKPPAQPERDPEETGREQEFEVKHQSNYYVVKEAALPEVLLRVVEAKRLLESERGLSVQDAAERVGISRSSFYKYKDDIHPFRDTAKGRTITFLIQMDDAPGFLASILSVIAEYHANILTIHQSVPVGGVAVLTISTEVGEDTGDISQMVSEIETLPSVHHIRIASRE